MAKFSVESQLALTSKIFAVVLLFGCMGMNAFGYPIAEEEHFDEEDIALSASTSLEVFSRLDLSLAKMLATENSW